MPHALIERKEAMNLAKTVTLPQIGRLGLLRSRLDGAFLRCLIAGGLNTGGAQVIRLAGNLILTRILFPEAFGLMAIVSVFLVGLEMFSDVGVGASIVHRKAEPSPAFLRTAWTLQAIRGTGLWLIACALAWPLARIYGKPELAAVLPVASFTLVLMGFKSTAVHLVSRHLRHGPLTAIDLSTAVFGLAVSIGLAAKHPSVWALVTGGLAAAVANLAASWTLPGQIRHRFCWDRESAGELIRFGRWILLATIFAFIATNGDRLLLGKFLTLEQLGIYTVAFFFSQSVNLFVSGLATRVLFPVLSRSGSSTDFHRYRRLLLGGSLLPLAVFLIAGPWLIEFLYDDRYLPAGGLLQILSFGAAAAVLRVLSEPLLLARGDSRSRMILSLCEAGLLLSGLAIGGALFGLPGFLAGYVAGQFLTLIPTRLLLRKAGVEPTHDSAAFIGMVGLFGLLGWILHGTPTIAL